MTEFKNASSDMKNANKNIYGGQASGFSSKSIARGYFPVVGVGAFDGFQTITPRGITTARLWERCEHWKEQPDRERTWSWTRKRESPSRFPTPIASQIQSDINRSCEGRIDTWNSNSTEFNQVSVNSVDKWDIWPGIVQIVGRVMTLESISNVLLAALWG